MVKPTVIVLQNTLQAVWREFLLTHKKIKHSKSELVASGNMSVAFGIQNRITPTGICVGSLELLPDPLSDLLNNPIKSCIFKKGELSLCYFGGKCERKRPLPENFKY